MRPFSLSVSFRVAVLACLSAFLASCADNPHRPHVAGIDGSSECPRITAAQDRNLTTPEVADNNAYTLHFLEFDDQGWQYPDKQLGNGLQTHPTRQIDCAMADLKAKLKQGPVRAFVFVHGWHHTAKTDDRDVKRFRDVLRANSADTSRQVVGFYVGWRGQSMDFPYLEDLSFWARKNAAHRVAEGGVREFFARIKSIRNSWNRPNDPTRENCGKPEAQTEGKGCPLRTVMLGHSFGGWILYASTAPYIMETLTAATDLPPRGKLPKTARERSIADMIILLNPAFEASRYEPLHMAAQHYLPAKFEPPLLVSITSEADSATKRAFPVARFFNSIFQYPVNSDFESHAIRNTHGHIDAYLTHRLTLDEEKVKPSADGQAICIDDSGRSIDREAMRRSFFDAATADGKLKLTPGWTRKLCGGLTLKHLQTSALSPYSIVWNIRTTARVIPGHNEIMEPALRHFLEQMYEDVGRAPRPEVVNAPVAEDADD